MCCLLSKHVLIPKDDLKEAKAVCTGPTGLGVFY